MCKALFLDLKVWKSSMAALFNTQNKVVKPYNLVEYIYFLEAKYTIIWKG